jgi:hypothetical protein
MSNFDIIAFEGNGFTVSTEISSGYSGSDQKDNDWLSSWRKAKEPKMKKVFTVVEKELMAMALGPDGPAFLRALTKDMVSKLETVWEEKIDRMDVPSHMKKGNGPCIYRMRLWNKSAVDKVDIELIITSLPPVEVRDGWKRKLTAALERDVKVEDFSPSLW